MKDLVPAVLDINTRKELPTTGRIHTSRAPQFRTLGASALHTLRNKYSPSSFRKGPTRHYLRIRPARRLKVGAPHSHPHCPLLCLPLAHPSSPYPVARRWGHASPTLRLGERGPGGARTAGGPRESEVIPATPWGSGAWPPPLSPGTKPRHRPPPASPASRRGRRVRTPTPDSPPGRKQQGGSRDSPSPPTGRPSPGSGLRKSRGQFPAAPLLSGSRDPGSESAGRVGGAWVSGERQVRPLEVSGGARLGSGPKPESRASVGSGVWEPAWKR